MAKIVWSSSETSRKATATQALKDVKKICRKPRRGEENHMDEPC